MSDFKIGDTVFVYYEKKSLTSNDVIKGFRKATITGMNIGKENKPTRINVDFETTKFGIEDSEGNYSPEEVFYNLCDAATYHFEKTTKLMMEAQKKILAQAIYGTERYLNWQIKKLKEGQE